ncbi:MAG: hypothetical protein AAGF12_33575 [Myxococcota bacterium]
MTINVTVAIESASLSDEGPVLRLPLDRQRPTPALTGTLKDPGVVRDALRVLGRVYESDLRFKASDRSDYLAFLLKQGKRATKELWEAQKAFLEEKFGEAEGKESPLPPLVTIDDAGVSLEVLSADESAYGRLTLRSGAAYDGSAVTPGTSHLRVDPAFFDALKGLRGYRNTQLELSSRSAEEAAPPEELRVPERWLRAFSQVQAASTLPSAGFRLEPIDFYNLLFTLRMRRAKKSPRALRYELVPGERPRMVLEPWDQLIESVGGSYEGGPRVVRTWGRRRLSVLSPLLAHIHSVRVFPMGPGLPVFYQLDLGACEFTLALSGWTDRGWAGLTNFDLLVPPDLDPSVAHQVDAALKAGALGIPELRDATNASDADLRQALLLLIQKGQVLHERATDRYRLRPLLSEPLDIERLRFRDAIEAEAHRFLSVPDQVRILKTHDLGTEGFRIEGEVEDKHGRRTYKTSFTIDREGRTVDASCTSRQFRRSGLREGPTAPMIALRLLYAQQQKELEAARQTEAGRKLIRAETRTFLHRRGDTSEIYRLSLDDRQVVLRWGPATAAPRMQRLMFGTSDAAQEEYFRRLDGFVARGFIDATRAEAVV